MYQRFSSKKEERLFYQNRRSAMARFCNMDTNATSYSKLCNIFANFAFLITLNLHEYNLTLQ